MIDMYLIPPFNVASDQSAASWRCLAIQGLLNEVFQMFDTHPRACWRKETASFKRLNPEKLQNASLTFFNIKVING